MADDEHVALLKQGVPAWNVRGDLKESHIQWAEP
jgi:hypothetical protein